MQALANQRNEVVAAVEEKRYKELREELERCRAAAEDEKMRVIREMMDKRLHNLRYHPGWEAPAPREREAIRTAANRQAPTDEGERRPGPSREERETTTEEPTEEREEEEEEEEEEEVEKKGRRKRSAPGVQDHRVGNGSWEWLEEKLDEAFAHQTLLGTRRVPKDNHTSFYLTPAAAVLSGRNRRKAEALHGDAGKGKSGGDLVDLARKRGYGATALPKGDLQAALSDLKQLEAFDEVWVIEQVGDPIPGINGTIIDALRSLLKKLGR